MKTMHINQEGDWLCTSVPSWFMRVLTRRRVTGMPWRNVSSIDLDPFARPDLVWDLRDLPLPIPDGSINELFAFEVGALAWTALVLW